MRICALTAVGFFFVPASGVLAGTLSEDGGAGVFRLQSAALPDENVFGIGLYNRLTNFPGGGDDAFNSLLKGSTVTDASGNPHHASLWALDHVLSASYSTMGFFETHVGLPMYTQLLAYDGKDINALAVGDLRYGFKLALPTDATQFPLAVALLLGGSLPTAELGAPVPRRLEYFPANPASTDLSHAAGTRRDEWTIGAAATLDLERLNVDNAPPWQIHFNAGARKTSALMHQDSDFYDVFSAGVGFEGRLWQYGSLVGEYWHENVIDTASHARLDEISLGLVFHTPIDLSVLVGGAVGLGNGEATKFGFYDENGHQYDANVRVSPGAQIILAVTYTLHGQPRDADGDGVPDRIDRCPHEPGPASNHGCPLPPPPPLPSPEQLHDSVPPPPQPVEVPQPLPEPPPEAPVFQKPVQQKTLILKGVSFETGKAVLTPESYPALDDIAAQLISLPEIELEVSGHTDNRGSEALNLKLSKARAQAVADYLVKKGVAPGRLKVAGYGFSKPVASNTTAEGRSQNRRVEFNRLK